MRPNDPLCPPNAHFLFMILQPPEMQAQISLCCIFRLHEDGWKQVIVSRTDSPWQALMFQSHWSKQQTSGFPARFFLLNSISAPRAFLSFFKYTGRSLPWGVCTRYSPEMTKTDFYAQLKAYILWGEKWEMNNRVGYEWGVAKGPLCGPGKTSLRSCHASVWGKNLPHHQTDHGEGLWCPRKSKGAGVTVAEWTPGSY